MSCTFIQLWWLILSYLTGALSCQDGQQFAIKINGEFYLLHHFKHSSKSHLHITISLAHLVQLVPLLSAQLKKGKSGKKLYKSEPGRKVC